MVPGVPITNHNYYIPVWGCKRNWNYSPVVDNKAAKPSGCSLEIERWKIEEAPNLILNLKLVSPIPFWRNRTIRTQNSILPWTTPLLNPGPVTTTTFQSLKSLKIYDCSYPNSVISSSKSYQVMRRFSSSLFRTLTTTLLLVVTLIGGPGNFPLTAITYEIVHITT